MKKKTLIITLLLLSQLSYAQVDIKSNKYNPYVNEILEIIVKVPGQDTQAPVQLIIEGSKYEIRDNWFVEYFYFNEINQKTEGYLLYTFKVTLQDKGKAIISCRIDNDISNSIEIVSKPHNLENVLPILQTEISDTSIYVREKAYLTNTVFSLNYIDDIEYTRPFINMKTSKLETSSKSKIILNNSEGQYRIVSAYSIKADKPGTYNIPESKTILYDKEIKIPGYTINVMELPKTISSKTIIGKSLKVEVINLLDEYKNGDHIKFNIKLTGNSNLSDITSLQDYFKIQDYLTETKVSRIEKYHDGKMLNELIFTYEGTINSIAGITIHKIKIPLFNTTNNTTELIVIGKQTISGNISKVLLYSGLITILIVVFGIILFTLHFLKKKPKEVESSDQTIEKYKLSNREKEIFIILVNGKSTKEIADELYISPETVKKHIQNILKKTNTNSRLELLAMINNAK